ncbi:chitobiase/beta-hexosaminidase C-terminal domain-containing protein [Candidatus Entotheonella palauensis]|nr:chitobiase/beta-hexosaminidase C-terminal domain-containing protein [Candidatus Entotheonella palauensis]
MDITLPVTAVVPAGGIYAKRPGTIQLTAEESAAIYYRWNGGSEERYTEPIAMPATDAPVHTLQVWAEDANGNREQPHREHYVLDTEVPHVELLGLNDHVMGGGDSNTLRWRSTATQAAYRVSVTSSGWGAGKTLATGDITPNREQQITLQGADLYDGGNRLWLRVTNASGQTAAVSHPLRVHRQAVATQVWPPGGVFGTAQTVTLRTTRPSAIFYTTDGSEPNPANAQRYEQPFTLEQTTTLRFLSEDAYGNREAAQQAQFDIRGNAATLTLLTPVPPAISGASPLVLKWQSDRDGGYDVTLRPQQHDDRRLIVQQGAVTKDKDAQSLIASHFLSPGDWFIDLRVEPDNGEPGHLRIPVRIFFRDTFEHANFIDTEVTTARLHTKPQYVELPLGPRSLAMYRTPGRSRYVRVQDSLAYVANGKAGLQIVDVSNPESPKRSSGFYGHGKARALALYEGYVYMAAAGSGVIIFDVSNPEAPIPVATTPVRGGAADISIAPPYAYVGTKSGTLIIFDLTEPLQPRRVSRFRVQGRIVDLAVHNGIVYLACLDQGLAIVDARDLQQPRQLHQWPTRQAATGVATNGTDVFIAADALEVLDITNPETPVHKFTHYLKSTYGVALHPPYALAPSGTNGVQVVRMSEQGIAATLRSGHYAARLSIAGQEALLADTRGGLQILDLTPPGPPRLRATLGNIGTIVDVVHGGDLAYLANDSKGSSLVVADISHADTPRVIGRYHSESTVDVGLWDRWAITGDTAARLQLLDLKAGPRPTLKHTLTLDQKIHRIALRPPYALVASDAAGVHVVEILPQGQLRYRTTFEVSKAITDEDEEERPGRALDIALDGDDAYVASVEGGIDIFDIRDPLQPKRKAGYRHADEKGDHIIRLTLVPNLLYAIDNKRGIQILQRTENGSLTWVHGMEVPSGAPWGFTASGPYLAVTTLLNALYMYDVSTPTEPKLLSQVPYGGSAVTAKDDMLYIAVRGRRGIPGGLRLVEGFSTISGKAYRPLKARGVASLPGAQPDTYRVPRAYTYHSPSPVVSRAVSTTEIDVVSARLQVQDYWGTSGRIQYALSNDGGEQWHDAEPGTWLQFPQPGRDLRWRATLETSDVVHTPALDRITIEVATNSR